MGKKTLYHPISLNTIRGAAEYGGWQLGKISQKWAAAEPPTARYEVTVLKMPVDPNTVPYGELAASLQKCFMDDISVHWFRRTGKGHWVCSLLVNLVPEFTLSPEEHMDIANGVPTP
jgi:hypothetical protein